VRGASSWASSQQFFKPLRQLALAAEFRDFTRRDESALPCFGQCLSHKFAGGGLRTYHIGNGLKRAGNGKAMALLDVPLRQNRPMQHEQFRDACAPPKRRRHGDMEPGRIGIRKLMNGQCRLVRIDRLRFAKRFRDQSE